VGGWMDGWMEGKAGLRIAYSNQKVKLNLTALVQGRKWLYKLSFTKNNKAKI
jgi:hypothetical protein